MNESPCRIKLQAKDTGINGGTSGRKGAKMQYGGTVSEKLLTPFNLPLFYFSLTFLLLLSTLLSLFFFNFLNLLLLQLFIIAGFP